MRLVLEGELSARFEMAGEGFEMTSEGPAISPYHLLAGSLASCTVLTLQSWAEGAHVEITPLTVHISWENTEDRPHRIARIHMELRWPGLPDDRIAAAERVADLCPIHATLTRAMELSRRIVSMPRSG